MSLKGSSFLFILISLPILLPAQDYLAYLSNESGNFDIFLMDEFGQNKRQLTTNKGWDWSPKWNRSLQAIVYNTTDTLGNFSVKTISLDGTSNEIDVNGMEDLRISPDGKSALYTLTDNKNKYIGIYHFEENHNQLLISNPSYNGRPEWSPDGKYFSFISDRDGNNEMYLYDIEGNNYERLTYSEKSEKYTSWLPDSKTIIYTYHYSDERENEHNDIFSIHIENKEKRQITNDKIFYQEIDVSPDGKNIAFHCRRDGKDHLFIIDINGENERQLSTVDAYHGEPEWIINKN